MTDNQTNSDNSHLNQAQNKQAFDRYLHTYENLTEQNLHQTLAPLMHQQIEFKDPFNHVHSQAEAIKVFEHMFENTVNPVFSILQSNIEHHRGMAYWAFEFKTSEDGERQKILGTSVIEIDANGLTTRHIDFWDPAENIYQKVPLLGYILRKIKQRLSAT